MMDYQGFSLKFGNIGLSGLGQGTKFKTNSEFQCTHSAVKIYLFN